MLSTILWDLIVSDCNTLITVLHIKLSGLVWLHLLKTWLNEQNSKLVFVVQWNDAQWIIKQNSKFSGLYILCTCTMQYYNIDKIYNLLASFINQGVMIIIIRIIFQNDLPIATYH